MTRAELIQSMSSDNSKQIAQRDQHAAQRAARRPTLQEEAEVPTHPNTPQDVQTPPPIPPRAPSRTQTPSQSPDQTRIILPYTPSLFLQHTPGRPLPPSPPIPSTTRAMSDNGY